MSDLRILAEVDRTGQAWPDDTPADQLRVPIHRSGQRDADKKRVGRDLNRCLSAAQFYAFVDDAHATSLAGPASGEIGASPRSVGGGVRFIHRLFTADLEVAKALVHFDGSDQRADPRVLLSLSASY